MKLLGLSVGSCQSGCPGSIVSLGQFPDSILQRSTAIIHHRNFISLLQFIPLHRIEADLYCLHSRHSLKCVYQFHEVLYTIKSSIYNTLSGMLALSCSSTLFATSLEQLPVSRSSTSTVICGARGPRPRYPRVWKTNKKIGTISKSHKLVERLKELSNVKEEVYGALDSFIAWDLEFPLITVKKALKTLENEKDWKRIIQLTKWMLSKGQGRTMGSHYTLLNALAEDGRIEEAQQLWARLFAENLESMPRMFFEKMVSIYHSKEMHDEIFEVFADMEELGVRPTGLIVEKVGDVFLKLDMKDKYEKLKKKYPPPKWEYKYIKGKRIRVPLKHLQGSDGEANGKHEDKFLQEGDDSGGVSEKVEDEVDANQAAEECLDELQALNSNAEK